MALNPQTFQSRKERRTFSAARDPERRTRNRRKEDLSWVPLFRGADQRAVLRALAHCAVIPLAAGTRLLQPGQTNDSIYIHLSGELLAHLDNGSDAQSAIAIPLGDCVGELSAIDGKPVSALVAAHTAIRVLKIPSAVFWDELMTLPSVARNLRIILSERLRSTNELALKAQREQLELIHLRKELDVARQLQASMLPLQRPLFPDRSEIEISGFMEPASSIGGDLFDAFFVGENVLFFCIGDVSGHGVASALFMARVVGLLRLLAFHNDQPDALLLDLNERLSAGNDANIFVTMFCGFLDVTTGVLRYSNGGHCAPLLRSAHGVEEIRLPKGPLIGAFPGVRYQSMELQLQSGETLLCYTDGVTEAQTPQGEEFSLARCTPLLQTARDLPLPDLLDLLRNAVADFTGTAALEDDCTLLALRRP